MSRPGTNAVSGRGRRVGFIGVGAMGLPMVRKLLRARHDVRVLARSDSARSRLAADGVPADAIIASASETVVDAEFVIVCLYSDRQVREVCVEGGLVDRMPPGGALIVHTTCDPRTIDMLCDAGEQRSVAVVDAPVSGGPDAIAGARLTVFLGGDVETVSLVTPVLQAYAGVIRHVGAAGQAQRIKLVNNALFGATIGLVCDAVRLGESLGVPETVLLGALLVASADSKAVRFAEALGSVRALVDTAGPFVSKDCAVAENVARQLSGDLGFLGNAASRFVAGRGEAAVRGT